MKLQERLFLSQLRWRTRPAVIVRHLHRHKQQPAAKDSTAGPAHVRVAAAQLELKLVKRVTDYVDEMARFTRQAAALGARLLVFPENNTYQLFGLIPGIDLLAKSALKGSPKTGKTVDIFHTLGPFFVRIAMTTFSTLASMYNIYIVAGSFFYPVDNRVYNRSVIFAPDGNLLGSHDKVHLLPMEASWGLSAGDHFQVFSTPFGGLAAPVCMDATFYETFRVLTQMGADIIALPVANPQEYNPWLALRGIWPRVQESPVYGIKSTLVGNLFGFTLTGKAGIYAPLPLSPGQDGVLAEAGSFSCEDLVVADLDIQALHKLRESHPYLGDQNPAVLNRYFPSLYKTSV